MRTALLLLAMLAAPAFAGQTVYKWVDEKGVTHFSDRPVPGATKVEISGGNRWDSAASPPPAPSQSPPEPTAGPPYRSLRIISPQQDQSLINTGGQVTVSISVDPFVQPDHRLYLYLDGRQVSGFQPNTALYELKEIPRGTHTAVAVVIDQRSGARVQESEATTFNVRQESIAKPPVGPTLRPPPKPRN